MDVFIASDLTVGTILCSIQPMSIEYLPCALFLLNHGKFSSQPNCSLVIERVQVQEWDSSLLSAPRASHTHTSNAEFSTLQSSSFFTCPHPQPDCGLFGSRTMP